MKIDVRSSYKQAFIKVCPLVGGTQLTLLQSLKYRIFLNGSFISVWKQLYSFMAQQVQPTSQNADALAFQLKYGAVTLPNADSRSFITTGMNLQGVNIVWLEHETAARLCDEKLSDINGHYRTDHHSHLHRISVPPSERIEPAFVTYDENKIVFSNGRHRTKAFLTEGAPYVPFEMDAASLARLQSDGHHIAAFEPSTDFAKRLGAVTKFTSNTMDPVISTYMQNLHGSMLMEDVVNRSQLFSELLDYEIQSQRRLSQLAQGTYREATDRHNLEKATWHSARIRTILPALEAMKEQGIATWPEDLDFPDNRYRHDIRPDALLKDWIKSIPLSDAHAHEVETEAPVSIAASPAQEVKTEAPTSVGSPEVKELPAAPTTAPKPLIAPSAAGPSTPTAPQSGQTASTSAALPVENHSRVNSEPPARLNPATAHSGMSSAVDSTHGVNSHIGNAALALNVADGLAKGDIKGAKQAVGETLVVGAGQKAAGMAVARIAGAEAVPIVGQVIGAGFAAADAVDAAKEGNYGRAAYSGVEATLYGVATTATVATVADCWNPTVVAPAAVAVVAGGAAVTMTAARTAWDSRYIVADGVSTGYQKVKGWFGYCPKESNKPAADAKSEQKPLVAENLDQPERSGTDASMASYRAQNPQRSNLRTIVTGSSEQPAKDTPEPLIPQSANTVTAVTPTAQNSQQQPAKRHQAARVMALS